MLQVVKDPFLKRLIDLECFVLSGLLADRYVLHVLHEFVYARVYPSLMLSLE